MIAILGWDMVEETEGVGGQTGRGEGVLIVEGLGRQMSNSRRRAKGLKGRIHVAEWVERTEEAIVVGKSSYIQLKWADE